MLNCYMTIQFYWFGSKISLLDQHLSNILIMHIVHTVYIARFSSKSTCGGKVEQGQSGTPGAKWNRGKVKHRQSGTRPKWHRVEVKHGEITFSWFMLIWATTHIFMERFAKVSEIKRKEWENHFYRSDFQSVSSIISPYFVMLSCFMLWNCTIKNWFIIWFIALKIKEM